MPDFRLREVAVVSSADDGFMALWPDANLAAAGLTREAALSQLSERVEGLWSLLSGQKSLGPRDTERLFVLSQRLRTLGVLV